MIFGFDFQRDEVSFSFLLSHPTALSCIREKIGADLAGKNKQHSETFIVAAVNERTLFIMTDKGTSA